MAFELRSPAFEPGQPIARRYTLDGENVSPPLEWSDPPPGTKSFALIVEDPDAPAGTFRHWGLYNIMADRRLLPEGVGHGVKTEDLGVGVNDFDNAHYDGPKPPKGHGRHRYCFRLLSLNIETLTQAPKARVQDIVEMAQDHVLGEAQLEGVYER